MTTRTGGTRPPAGERASVRCTATFRHELPTPPDGVVDRIRGVSHVAALDAGAQAEVLDAVRRLLAEHPDTRGRDDLRVPYRVDSYWRERDRG